MTFYEFLLSHLDAAEIDLFIGTGYVRLVYRGLEFNEWLLVPWQVEELEEKANEEGYPC